MSNVEGFFLILRFLSWLVSRYEYLSKLALSVL